jgi:hypothetical protein
MEAKMPVLCFPCVVTARDGAIPTGSRRIWIKGHDFTALALAATEHLGASSDACRYLLFTPKVPHPSGVFLEVVHDGCSALVGPMAGPTPPTTFDDEREYSLSDLLMRVGLGRERDGAQARVYPVTVTHTGFFRTAAESVRIECACHEGFYVVRYDPEPETWKARDLECLMALAYACLPKREPRWRESGAIVQEPMGTGAGDGAFMLTRPRYCVHIARGDYAAYLRLPDFPVLALTEWLATRRCEILLDQPVVRTEALAEQLRIATAQGGVQ